MVSGAGAKMRRPIRRTIKRSRFEDAVAKDLTQRGVPFKYEGDSFLYIAQHKYIPDFTLPNGVIVEAKGWFKSKDRTKHLLVRAGNPSLDIRFLFQRAENRLSKTSKTTYADWCDKHKFMWAEGRIPSAWLDESPW